MNTEEAQHERGRILEEAALFDTAIQNIAFLHQRLLELHALVDADARLIRMETGFLTSVRFSIKGLYALSKAPSRAFASGLLRKFPKAKAHINRLRRIPDAA
jgi:hypothetical protein